MKKKVLLIAICILIVDIISKQLVSNIMVEDESISIILNLFYITYAKNIGVAFSMLEGSRLLIILITIIIIGIIYKYISNKDLTNIEQISFGLIIGGSIGNLIDRIIYGYVIDFLDFKIGNFNYPIFNIADSAIVIGVILLLIINIKNESRELHEISSRQTRKNR